LHLPRPNTWPFNSQRLGQFRPYCLCDLLRAAVWRVCHIPPDKLLDRFGNLQMHSNSWHAMALKGI
jgi:hypothetical protein